MIQVQKTTNRAMEIEELVGIKSREFEELVADTWEAFGYDCEVTPPGPDKGVDVIAEAQHPVSVKHAIQVKRYDLSNKVGRPAIQQYSALKSQIDNVDSVVVVTSSEFTSDALQLADQLNLKTLSGETLISILSIHAPEILESYSTTSSGSESSGVNFTFRRPSNHPDNETETYEPPESKYESVVVKCPTCNHDDFRNNTNKSKLTCKSCGTSYPYPDLGA